MSHLRTYKNVVPMNVYPLCYCDPFIFLLLSFCLHITYRKVRNLHVGADKLVGKVINKIYYIIQGQLLA